MKHFITIAALLLASSVHAATLYIDGVRQGNVDTIRLTTRPAAPPPVDPPEPTPPPATGCDAVNVQCRYNVSYAELVSSQREQVRVEIPRGTTVVSSFPTSSSTSADFVRFSFTTPVGGARQPVDVWVSASVMGETVSSRCDLENVAYNYQLRATTYASFYCRLDPDSTYYLHIRHVDALAPASTMIRELTAN